MPNAKGDFVWYELLTKDADGAKAFYEAVVPGWQVGPPSPEHQGYREIDIGGGSHAGGLMPLNEEMVAGGARPIWLGYAGVDDVDASIAKAVELGASIQLPAFDIPGIGRIAMIADPEGAPIYLMRGAIDEASDAFSTDAEGHVSWNELAASDAAAAIAFYTALFGWELGDAMDMGPMGKYQFIVQQGVTIGAIFPKPPQQPMPKWTYYIRVPSIGAAKARIEAHGGRVIHGPQEVPGGDVIIDAFDPQGASFALVGKA